MIVRECVEFIVYPKMFHVVSFYTKGNYALLIKLSHQDQQGKITSAYPILYEGKDSAKLQLKKAGVQIEEAQGKYTTQQFYITYSEQSVILNTLCTFKLQYEMKKKYKTFIDIDVIATKFKIINSIDRPQKPINHLEESSVSLQQKIIYQQELAYKVVFDECEYFSYLDLYIASVSVGYRIRNHPYQMCQFFTMNKQSQQNYHQITQIKWIHTQQQKGLLLKQLFSRSSDIQNEQFNITNFYQLFVLGAKDEYERIGKLIKSYIECMKLLNNASQLAEEQELYQLYHIGNYKWRDDLQRYYGYSCSNSIIYYEIYQQSLKYWKNVIHTKQKLCLLLCKMNSIVFHELLQYKLSTSDDFVKRVAIITNKSLSIDSRYLQKIRFIERRKQLIQSQIIYEDSDVYHPLLMIESSQEIPNDILINNEVQSLTVFIHGYQGSDIDLEKAKNYMSIYNNSSYGLLVKSIQDQQQPPIQQLGLMLSEQIKSHICKSNHKYKRINFVGYSLGGVLARQTLKHLSEYKSKMNLFISFASPHLGIRNSDNALVGTGIWYLINISKVKTLRQLHIEIEEHSQLPILQKLSECQCLSWFKKVVLVSSRDDNFVPYYSSRLDQINDDLMVKMCRNIKTKINRLERVEVWFDVDHDTGTLDKILGRRAHIQFLQNRGFLNSFFKIYACQL